MKTQNLKHQLLKYLIIFVTGYCMYIATEVSFRGYSYILMGIVGGIAFVTISTINDKISWDIPLIVQMLIGGVIITLFELVAGLFSRHVLNIEMWDYSNQWGNFLGLICPLFSVVWVLLSFVPIILSDAICYYALHENPRPYYKSITKKVLFRLPKRECDEAAA